MLGRRICAVEAYLLNFWASARDDRPIAPQTEEAPVSESGTAVSTNEEKLSTAKAIYILYIVGWIIPIIAQIVGVIFAYINREEAPPWLQTHFQLQIRTFWIGLLFGVISVVTS